jgi:hypothetical protein
MLVLLLPLMGLPLPSEAMQFSYQGLIELDHGSSIPGIPRHSRYWVDFILNGSVLDTDHFVEENAIENANGVKGISTAGLFPTPFLYLRFTADPTGPATLDLSGLNFNYADTGGSGALVRNAEPPPPINPHNVPYCDTDPCVTEHINLSIRDVTAGAPVNHVFFNFYNSWLYDPELAKRQLLLDTSASGNPFPFEDLFITGPASLAEFRSYRTPNFMALRDGVFLDGPGGSVASGRFLSLVYVPPVPAPLPLLGAASALAWSRRLRRRIRQPGQASAVHHGQSSASSREQL